MTRTGHQVEAMTEVCVESDRGTGTSSRGSVLIVIVRYASAGRQPLRRRSDRSHSILVEGGTSGTLARCMVEMRKANGHEGNIQVRASAAR